MASESVVKRYTTRQEAETVYREIRESTGRLVSSTLGQALKIGPLRISDIDSTVVSTAMRWRSHGIHESRASWNWSSVLRKIRQRPRRVEFAIWADDVLCGLGAGWCTKGRLCCRLAYVEGAPIDNPLKGNVLFIALRYLELFGSALGVSAVSLENPASALVDLYSEFGFKVEKTKHNYVTRMSKDVQAG